MNEAFKKFDLTGKTAFVTGGGTGLGYYMTRGLARSGATVMIAARRADVLREAAAKISAESNGNRVLYTTMNLENPDDVTRTSEKVVAELGGVDIFVGNAAQDTPEPIGKITYPVMNKLLQVNVAANIMLFQGFLPHMRQNKWGRVIFSSSIGSKRAQASSHTSVYAACKGALNTFTHRAAAEVGRDNITVNSIIIGLYKTQLFIDALVEVEQLRGPEAAKAFTNSFAEMSALGRFGLPEELEGVIQLLASNAGSNICGSEITVDGGMSTMMKPNPIVE
jgi:NAD(P)-dependent dehydrogenase (short-subunit alcohol dehydrogenase family)